MLSFHQHLVKQLVPEPQTDHPARKHRFFDRDLNAVASNAFMDDATVRKG